MWNPFKKKDPMAAISGVYFLAESFLPELVAKFNCREFEESIFTDKGAWSKMLPKNEMQDFRLKKITATSSDFKKNHDVCLAFIKWPEVKFPTAAKACIVYINRLTHKAILYVLENSFCGSMIIKMAPGGRMNTCITVPADSEEYLHFMKAVVDIEGIRWK